MNHLAFGPGNAKVDRPQHRRSGALEALSRRHRRPSVDRCRRRRHVSPDERAQRQPHEPDAGRRPRLFPVRCRRRRQSLLLPARWNRSAAAHRSRRLLRAPRADRWHAHRLSMRRRHLAVRPRERSHRACRHRGSVASHAGGAQVRAGRKSPGRVQRPSRRPQPGGGRARETLHVCALGRRGSPARRGRRRPLPARSNGCTMAPRWSRSATSRARSACRFSTTAPSRRCPGISAGSRTCAPRPPPTDRDLQPSQRSADGRSRHRDARGDRSQRCRPHRGPRVVARRRMARLLVLDQRAALRDQAARRRGRDKHAGDRARVPRLFAGVRSGRPVPVLPVGAHLRPGLRRRAVRAELSARGAPVPDRAAGGPAPAVRSGAQGPEARDLATEDGQVMRRRSRQCASTSTGSSAASPPSRSPKGASARSPARPTARCCGRCCRSPARTAAADTRIRRGGWRFSTSRRCAPRRCSSGSTASSLAADHTTLVVREGKAARASAHRKGRSRSDPRRHPKSPRARAAGSTWAASACRSSRGSEWRQMLREVWRLQRDQFWVAGHVGHRLGRRLPPV